MINLAVLYVEYDTEKYKGAFPSLLSYLEKIKFCNKTIFIISNQSEGSFVEEISSNMFRMGGDNTNREFSGWQRGLDSLRAMGIQYDVILFVNETFDSYRKSFLSGYATLPLILRALWRNTVIGWIDYHRDKVSVLGYDTSEWIRTNCFLMPKTVADALGTVCTLNSARLNEFFDLESQSITPSVFRSNAPISLRYREFIIEWLTAKWHGRFKLDERTLPLFMAKTQAILNESLLTARIKENGYRIASYSLVNSIKAAIIQNARFIFKLSK